MIGEYDGGGTAIQETVFLGDMPIAVLTDQINTPRLITDTQDAARWRWDSDAFGNGAPNQNPGGLALFSYNLRFPGQYFDSETGLHYNYFRDYEPSTGRYLQSDPIGLAGGINPYLYANANPLRYTDPTGEIVLALPALAALGEAVAFVGSAALAGAVLSSAWDDLTGDVPDSAADDSSDDKSKQCPNGSDDDDIDCDEWLDLLNKDYRNIQNLETSGGRNGTREEAAQQICRPFLSSLSISMHAGETVLRKVEYEPT